MQPAHAVLITERPRLAAPVTAFQVFRQLRLAELVHPQLGHRHLDARLSSRPLPYAEAAVDMMRLAAQHFEHLPSAALIARLAQDISATLDHGVAGDNNARANSPGYVERLLTREPSHESPRRFARS